MQTHRIPQHVTGYQGRILGRLNPKQFIYLAVGGVTVFMIFSTLSLSMTTILIAVMIAFFTVTFSLAQIEERSLDQWLKSFVVALQSTPQRVWKKEGLVPSILIPSYKPYIPKNKEEEAKKSQEKLDTFLSFWRKEGETELTEHEVDFLQKLEGIKAPDPKEVEQLKQAMSAKVNQDAQR